MFKGVFSEDGNANKMYRHFFTDAISESVASGGGFGLNILGSLIIVPLVVLKYQILGKKIREQLK